MESENEIKKVPEKVIGGGTTKETKEEVKEKSKEVIKEEAKKEKPKKVYKMELVKGLDGIFILGRGQSLGKCPVKRPDDSEYWGCNNIYKARGIDRLFIMHDVYMVQDIRDKNLIKDINGEGFPVYTLGLYPELKNNVRYPVEGVIKEFKTSFILNTAAYMIALAIMQEPKKILLAGIDMELGTSNEYLRNEKGCLEFWLGMALGRGIKFILAEGSTLLRRKGLSNYYGLIEKSDGLTTRLEPRYSWGRSDGKSALHYKIILNRHCL